MKALTKELILRDFHFGIEDELAQHLENIFKGQLFTEEQILALVNMTGQIGDAAFSSGIGQASGR